MKRFLFSIFLCLGITTLPAALILHFPAQGALQLGDNGNAPGIQRGIVMQTILTNPNFVNEINTIKAFLGLNMAQPINMSYQQIMQLVQQSTGSNQAIAVIEAFEKALMHQYHYDTYIVGSYQPWQSIFFTGIKYNWLSPIQWINPTSWINYNDPNLNQIMKELSFLGKIAQRHSTITSQRINATVASYLHWRQYVTIIITTYFAADMCKRGWNNSSLYDLYSGGLTNSPTMLVKLADNLCSASKFTAIATITSAKCAYSITKPIINLILFGAHGYKAEDKND